MLLITISKAILSMTGQRALLSQSESLSSILVVRNASALTSLLFSSHSSQRAKILSEITPVSTRHKNVPVSLP